MSDRALQISVGLSLAIHLIASVGLSGDRWATPVLRPPAAAPPVRVRLAGPPTEKASEETALPSVAAALSRPRPGETPTPRPVVDVPVPVPVPETPVATPAREPVATELAAVDVPSHAAEAASSGGASHGGTPVGTAPDALPDSSGASEEQDRLARYVEEIRARIQARKHYPPLARKRSVEGRVVARVAIRADGRLTAVEFDPTTPPLLRRATDDAIRSAAPYPAPPSGDITIEFPVEYSLRDSS